MSIQNKGLSIFIASTLIALAGCSQTPNEAATPAPSAAAASGKDSASAHSMAKTDLDAAVAADGHCALDEINGNVFGATLTMTVKAGQDLTAGGWAVTNALQAPTKLTLVLRETGGANAYGIDGVTGVSRPDVAKAMNSDAAGTSGFNIAGSLGNTPAGTYEILLLAKSADKSELCDTKRQVTIGN